MPKTPTNVLLFFFKTKFYIKNTVKISIFGENAGIRVSSGCFLREIALKNSLFQCVTNKLQL